MIDVKVVKLYRDNYEYGVLKNYKPSHSHYETVLAFEVDGEYFLLGESVYVEEKD